MNLQLKQDFEAWKISFNKSYETMDQHARALETFVMNDAYIRETNAKNLSYWVRKS